MIISESEIRNHCCAPFRSVSPSTRRRPRRRRRSMSVLARTGDGIRGISVSLLRRTLRSVERETELQTPFFSAAAAEEQH